jgi:type II secretory pathway pseudopilin PulG
MTVSPERGKKKNKPQPTTRSFVRSRRFVHRPGGAVIFRSPGKSGFTLVEILATFVLMAIILPVAMNGISMAGKLASQARHRVEAATLAQEMLNDLVLTGDYEDGDQEGDVEGDIIEFSWSLKVLDYEEEDSMQQLDLSVTWEDAGSGENTVVLSTLVYAGSEE